MQILYLASETVEIVFLSSDNLNIHYIMHGTGK